MKKNLKQGYKMEYWGIENNTMMLASHWKSLCNFSKIKCTFYHLKKIYLLIHQKAREREHEQRELQAEGESFYVLEEFIKN